MPAQKHGKIVVIRPSSNPNRPSSGLVVGDYIAIERKDKRMNPLKGYVAFSGPVNFADGLWVGIRLDNEFEGEGHNDGTVKGERYFEKCRDKCGYFIQVGPLTRTKAAQSFQRRQSSANVGDSYEKRSSLSNIPNIFRKSRRKSRRDESGSILATQSQLSGPSNRKSGSLRSVHNTRGSMISKTSGRKSTKMQEEPIVKKSEPRERIMEDIPADETEHSGKNITKVKSSSLSGSTEALSEVDQEILLLQKEKEALEQKNRELMDKGQSMKPELQRLRNRATDLSAQTTNMNGIPSSIQIYREDDSAEDLEPKRVLAVVDENDGSVEEATISHSVGAPSIVAPSMVSSHVNDKLVSGLQSQINYLKTQLKFKSDLLAKTFSTRSELQEQNQQLELEVFQLKNTVKKIKAQFEEAKEGLAKSALTVNTITMYSSSADHMKEIERLRDENSFLRSTISELTTLTMDEVLGLATQ